MPLRLKPEELPPVHDEARYISPSWRAEAWERERARELRAQGNHPDLVARRRTRA